MALQGDLAGRDQRRAADPRASVWVGASAGTGKTKVLTDRLLRLLLDGCRPERILCLTFTKAASAEMANRLADQLARWASGSEKELEESLYSLGGDLPAFDMMVRARLVGVFFALEVLLGVLDLLARQHPVGDGEGGEVQFLVEFDRRIFGHVNPPPYTDAS